MSLQLRGFLPIQETTTVEPTITLYTLGSSPNGQKITILLELLELRYNYKKIDIYSNEHKQDWFLKLNPNGRIPVLTDSKPNYSGEQEKSEELITIFETGAILTYLSERYDLKSKFSYSLERFKNRTGDYTDYESHYWDQINWLMFQISDHSPIQGQLSFFTSAVKQLKGSSSNNSNLNIQEFNYAVEWYKTETINVFRIYEQRLLDNNGWIVGDGLNIADISAYPWIIRAKTSNILNFDEFPEILKWIDRLEMFERVRKGMTIG